MRSLQAFSLIFLVLVLFISNSFADTWYINPEGTGDAATIQAGIDLAAAGDTVLLANGTYTTTSYLGIDFLGKAIVVRSQSNDPESCILDCAEQTRGFYFHSYEGSGSVLEGVKVTNGVATSKFPDNLGGGVYCFQSSPTIRNCIFSNCLAYEGGGLSCWVGGFPTVSDCIFSGNSAVSGGAVSAGSLTLTNCTFADNSADLGGAIRGGNFTLINCTFVRNEASSQGGAVWIGASNNFVISNSIIAFSLNGGAVYGDESSSATLSCCDIYGNAGGDWTGLIAGQLGINGNINLNPRFCPDGSPDAPYTLREDSPCSADNHPTCSLIGAWSVGCGKEGVCSVEPGALHFGSVRLDEYVDKTFIIRNIMGDPITGDVSESCDHFSIQSGQGNFTLAEDESLEVVVRFEPTERGSFNCLVTTTNGSCGDVPCSGYGGQSVPVTVQAYESKYVGDHVEVTWTLHENDPSITFEVSRKETKDEHYITLSQPEISQQGLEYNFKDRSAEHGQTYTYRIGIIDRDGFIVSFTTTIMTPAMLLALQQNYPNPFNPSTTISYSLPDKIHAQLAVYNLDGKLVRMLVDEDLDEGYKQTTWDGKNSHGNAVASGVYFCRLIAGDKMLTRKMVVIR
jgi:predicted outer membrane repeat protein